MNDETMDYGIPAGAHMGLDHSGGGHPKEPEWALYLEDRVNQLEDMVGQIAGYLQHQGESGPDTGSMGHMVRNAAQHQLVQHVAGHLSPQAQQFMHSLLGNLDPHDLANVYQSPHAIALLQRAAQAEHHNSTGPHTAAPQGEDVWHKGGNMDADAQKEIEQYLQAFGPQGVTPDMAVAAYRRATGGGR